MATAIEWTDTVWNPVTGCTKVSEGCRNCYAFALHDMRHKAFLEGKKLPQQYAKPFSEIQLFPDRLNTPLSWKKPKRVFVNSMSDLFHEDVPFDYIGKVFDVMATAQYHIFQVLTKRPERMRDFMSWWFAQRVDPFSDESYAYVLPNVWLGTSVENQQAANERIPLLLQTPAAVRFLSCEPLLGPVDLNAIPRPDNAYFWQRGEKGCLTDPNEPDDYVYWNKRDQIHWVIVGGESGTNARPIHPAWVRKLRNQCQAADVSFFFKQWGEWISESDYQYGDWPKLYAKESHMFDNGVTTYRVGKQRAGRLLDGQEWNEFPKGGERDASRT